MVGREDTGKFGPATSCRYPCCPIRRQGELRLDLSGDESDKLTIPFCHFLYARHSISECKVCGYGSRHFQ